MNQLLFTHTNYDAFHSYIRLTKYLFQKHAIFLNDYFSCVFIKNLLHINPIFNGGGWFESLSRILSSMLPCTYDAVAQGDS